MFDITAAVRAAGIHIGNVIQMMHDGVAFPVELNGQVDGSKYWIFSHEGDQLGTASTHDVGAAIHFMKRIGRAVGKLDNQNMKGEPSSPGFSFAWEGWYQY